MTSSARIRLLLAALLLAAACGDVFAQERSGLIGGVSLGGGTLNLRGSSDAPTVGFVSQGGDSGLGPGFNLYLGGMTGSRAALLFEMALTTVDTEAVDGEVRLGPQRVTFGSADSSLSPIVMAGAAQYWVRPNIWVRGGLGVGLLDRDLFIESSDLTITLDQGNGVALLGAAGVEVWRRGNFALDTQFHFTTFALKGLRVHSPSVQIGLTWG